MQEKIMTLNSLKTLPVILLGVWGALDRQAWGLSEPGRTIPVIQDVDVVVAGSTCGAVAAAESAAKRGAKVFLVTPSLSLGEDVAGTLRVWAEPQEVASSALMGRMFATAGEAAPAAGKLAYTTPLRVKQALDKTLLEAGVPFLTGVYPTDVLVDASGQLAGVVIGGRSGRQAIRAKVVIDATPRANLARKAGGRFTAFPAGSYSVTRVVITGNAPANAGTVVRHDDWQPDRDWVQLPSKFDIEPALFECSFPVTFADGSARALAEAEQAARDRTFTSSQLDAADHLGFVPPDHVQSAAPCTQEGVEAEKLDLSALVPDGVPACSVLSGLADVPRSVAAGFGKPAFAIRLGARLGVHAAAEAKKRVLAGEVRVAGSAATGKAADIREVASNLAGPLVAAAGTIRSEPCELPVLGDTDLVIAGGGTTGASAGVGAVRNGLHTVVVEQLWKLGGVQTAGMICGYFFGNQRGFTKELDEGVAATGLIRSQAKAEWYRKSIREGQGEIWLGAMVTGALLEGGKLTGVVVVTPDGTRGILRAKAVIDASGNADVAAAAGEPTEFFAPEELIGQGVGMAVIRLGESGHNNDFAMVDDSDAADLCFFGLRTRLMTEGGWDVSQLVNSRERRRLVGVFQVSALDYLTGRTYPDTIIQHRSRFDLHGAPSHDFFYTKNIRTTNHVALEANGPYRALLPRQTNGLLVAGLGMSATRDAMAIMRMQADLQNQGYAAAYAVRLALEKRCELRDIPIRELQGHLVQVGILPESVLHEQDSYPIPDSLLKLAAHDVMMGYGGLPFLFADPERAKPILREKYAELSKHSSGRNPEVSLIYAHILAMLGEPAGEEELIKWVAEHDWDDKWPEDTGSRVNRMETYVLALGRAGSAKAAPAILAKGQELCDLKKEPSWSRCRALGLASVALHDSSLASMLAKLLDAPGVSGHAIRYAAEIPPVPGYTSRTNYSQQEKMEGAREVNLATCLYRLGDCEGKGRAVLEAYANDPRGFFANFARQVLAEKRS